MGKLVCRAKLGLVACAIWMSPAAAFSPTNDLVMHGESYPNACSETQLRNSKASLVEKKPLQAMQAWHAIRMLLCAPVNSANVHLVAKLLTRRVNSSSEGTGSEPKFESVAGNAELARNLMAGGRAWNVSILVDHREIKLHYAPDEACIAGVTLENPKGTWRITEFGEACD